MITKKILFYLGTLALANTLSFAQESPTFLITYINNETSSNLIIKQNNTIIATVPAHTSVKKNIPFTIKEEALGFKEKVYTVHPKVSITNENNKEVAQLSARKRPLLSAPFYEVKIYLILPNSFKNIGKKIIDWSYDKLPRTAQDDQYGIQLHFIQDQFGAIVPSQKHDEELDVAASYR